MDMKAYAETFVCLDPRCLPLVNLRPVRLRTTVSSPGPCTLPRRLDKLSRMLLSKSQRSRHLHRSAHTPPQPSCLSIT